MNPFNPSFESFELRCRRGRGHETGKGILTSSSSDKLEHGDVCLKNNFLHLTFKTLSYKHAEGFWLVVVIIEDGNTPVDNYEDNRQSWDNFSFYKI